MSTVPTALTGSVRRVAAATLLPLIVAGIVALRLAAVFHVPVNSDEPQHLHIVWAWTQGLLPYRDVFDNHMPLYQWLSVPPLAVLGERADIVFGMRLAQLPFALALLAVTYRLGARLWNRRVGVCAVLLATLLPGPLAASTEYRPDVPWALLWIAALAALLLPHARRRWPLAGLCLGLALVVSLKTVVLLAAAALTLAPVALWAWRGGARPRLEARRALTTAALFLLPLALVATALYALQIVDSAWYCLVAHNIAPGLGHAPVAWHRALLPLLVGAALAAAWFAPHSAPAPGAALRRFVLLFPGVYLALLWGWWPLVPKQDWLPAWPLLALGAGAALDALARRVPRFAAAVFALPLLLAAAMLASGFAEPPSDHTARLERVLRLTRPGDYVMDAKGDSVFRPRPYYFALETITRHRLQTGLLPDHIAQAMMESGTKVVLQTRMPEADERYVAENYLPIGDGVWVLGKHLAGPATASRELMLPMAATYAAVCAGDVRPRIDGLALATPRELERGTHRITAEQPYRCLLVWAGALERDPAIEPALRAALAGARR